MRSVLILLSVPLLLGSCCVNKSLYLPAKKYSPEQLQEDYTLYREILETHHPGLYWYTSKENMDHYFDKGMSQLKDSLTEPQFRKVLSYVTAKINCGHTSVRPSKAWGKRPDTTAIRRLFPFSVKVWPDTMVITSNLDRKDSILTRGTVVTSINGVGSVSIVDSLFEFLSTDGYNLTHKYQSLSNRGFFGSLYNSVYGASENYKIGYLDSNGNSNTITIPAYNPFADSLTRKRLRTLARITPPSKKERKKENLNNIRLLKIDTVNKSAMMDLSSFARGYKLRNFFCRSFRTLRKNKINDLIIDVRSNGGGSVTNSTIITRYITDKRFKVADSLYAVRKKSPYYRYIQNHFWNKLFIAFFTRKRKDGYYHFGYFEKHYFRPKKKNHFDGKVYILTGGNSFSATTLFTSALIKQENVIVVGEETGGGAYGNSAWLIPDVTLPETGVRFRLPLFRLVIDKDSPRNGKGVQPEIKALPTIEAIRRNVDFKVEKAMELIQKDQQSKNN
ncbi:MAG TPA: S41 family peptidase [Chitinophagaceae bacterium]|nr:S41 family peptidase [Chitinophagaceae bacterium]